MIRQLADSASLKLTSMIQNIVSIQNMSTSGNFERSDILTTKDLAVAIFMITNFLKSANLKFIKKSSFKPSEIPLSLQHRTILPKGSL